MWNTSDADCAKSSLQKHQAFNRHEWLIQALDNAKNANNPEVTASQNATLYAHNQFNKCVITSRKYYPDELMPIEGWRSKDSYVPKLGTVVSVLWAQGCIAAIAIVALLISRTLREVQA